MPIKNDDLLLVNRGGTNYQVDYGTIDAGGLQTADLLTVQRDAVQYQVAFGDIKSGTSIIQTNDFFLVQRGDELYSKTPFDLPPLLPDWGFTWDSTGLAASDNVINFSWTGARSYAGDIPPQIRFSGGAVYYLGASGKISLTPSEIPTTGTATVIGTILIDFSFTSSKGLVTCGDNPVSVGYMSNSIDGSSSFGQGIFAYCTKLTTAPIALKPNTMLGAFANSPLVNSSLAAWDVSQVKSFSQTFSGATAFNQDISSWDVTSATNMASMFRNATSFNKNLQAWGPNTGNVTSFTGMFSGASGYNQPMNDWDTSGTTSSTALNRMFNNATIFSQPLTNWCVTYATSEPTDFSAGSALTNAQLPIWGTCP